MRDDNPRCDYSWLLKRECGHCLGVSEVEYVAAAL